MMDIEIFKELTTEDYLIELEAESEKYDGLYVDMDNAPERKYVKDKAVLINELRKKVDRARIDIAKKYKKSVEDEFAQIDKRLIKINEPFTNLIDEYKEKRNKILADEKADKEAEALLIQIESDHEFALLMDKTILIDKKNEAEAKEIRDKQIAADAADLAIKRERKLQDAKKADEKREREDRENNIKHVSNIRREAKECLMNTVSESDAKIIVMEITSGRIKNVTINY